MLTLLPRLVLGALLVGSAQGQAPAPQALFTPAGDQALANVPPDPTFATERLVAVRAELLPDTIDLARAPRFALELESGKLETALLDRSETLPSGAVAFGGSLEGAPQSSVHLVRRGNTVAGSVRDGARLYKVNWAGNGWHRVARVDESRFPPCATGPEHAVADRGGSPAPGGGYLANPNPTIDVLVVYTPLARQNAGGTTAIESLVDLAVVETNQAYANSQVNQRLRLVHQEELTGYAENGDFNTELNRLTNTGDGWFDHVHGLRDLYGADEVAMIVDSTQYCGIGWLMTTLSTGFEDRAFTVTSKQCATGYYSFAHELGHNMASHHDHGNASGALYSYSYGHRTASGANRTIMAYAPGTRIQYFSNPNISYQGEALGIPEGQANAAENWKSLNNTATTVARFRCAVPAPYGTGKLNSQGARPTLSWSGTPSASANNLHVLVGGAIPGKVGLVFWGTQPNSAPLSGGTLWVGGSITRLPPQASNGSGAADFPFPLAALPPGDVVYAQHWGRDPQHPDGFGASLSNGLRLDVCP
ncbi:MAG: hypothetical protein IPK67_17190 [Planctomycetes bacterium]|jgi:hypothetical protein|nr:hypothetical protein [Planctomycetota bacterium]